MDTRLSASKTAYLHGCWHEASVPYHVRKDTKSLFHDSIHTEFLEITKLYRQEALHRLPRVWNKNGNVCKRERENLWGDWIVAAQ